MERPETFDEKVAERFKAYTRLPAWYPINLELGGEDGDNVRANTQLRPEPFVLYRISWATTADTFPFYRNPMIANGSIHGRSVECRFGDAFTTFLGQSDALVSAVFGDANGFLDIPRGALFQGSQPIDVSLTRLFWPGFLDDGGQRATTRWDFVFAGMALLPAGVNQSGSAG